MFFRSGARLYEVAVRTDGGVSLGPPLLVFERSYEGGRDSWGYDLRPSSGQFIMLRNPRPPHLRVTAHWWTRIEEAPTARE